jgi:hypothetical protein
MGSAMIIKSTNVAFSECVKYFNSQVFSKVDGDYWIAGGALRDWVMYRKPMSDIDCWFANQQTFDAATENAKKVWSLTKETEATINWKTDTGKWVQFIKKTFYADLQSTIEAFDFTACCIGVDRSGTVMHHQEALADIALKRLAFNAILFPTSTFKRVAKYCEKGFKICPDQQTILLGALKRALAESTIEEANARYME